MFCSKCGNETIEDAVFCNKCGAQLTIEKVRKEPLTTFSNAGQKVNGDTKKRRVLLVSIIVVLVLAVASLATYIIISPVGATDGGYVAATYPETIPAYQDEVVSIIDGQFNIDRVLNDYLNDIHNITFEEAFNISFTDMDWNYTPSDISELAHHVHFSGRSLIHQGNPIVEIEFLPIPGMHVSITSIHMDGVLQESHANFLSFIFDEVMHYRRFGHVSTDMQHNTSNVSTSPVGAWISVEPFFDAYDYFTFFDDGTGLQEWDGWGYEFLWDMESLVATLFDDLGNRFYYSIEIIGNELHLIPFDSIFDTRVLVRIE